MKKIKPLLVICSALTFVAALAFVNNIVAIAKWWSAFLAAGGDSSSVSAKMPGFIPWLDWTAVDYSAVTTFIPLLGLLCLTVSLVRLARGKRMRSGDFPFFKGSDQLNVALGLFGTLWGIIVIGYFKLDTVSMADLMQCLHTALFSTLMAVVWVFMIDRPLLRPYFTRLLGETGLAETDDGDLAAAVDRLVVRLGAASDAFDARQKAFEAAFEKRAAGFAAEHERRAAEYAAAFEKRAAEASAAAEKREAASAAAAEKRAAAYAADFERRRAEYAAHFEKRLADYEKDFDARQKEYVEFFRRRIDELEKRAAESDARLKAVAAAIR